MTISTNASGIACCGNCGHELEIRCSGGCAEPDVVFRDDYIASLPKPRGTASPAYKPGQPKAKKPVKYPPPTHCWCGDPVAKKKPGRGRPPTKCEKHLPPSRAQKATT